MYLNSKIGNNCEENKQDQQPKFRKSGEVESLPRLFKAAGNGGTRISQLSKCRRKLGLLGGCQGFRTVQHFMIYDLCQSCRF